MTWPDWITVLVSITLGLLAGYHLAQQREWLKGYRMGYQEGRTREKLLCGIEHPRKLPAESVLAIVEFDRKYGSRVRGTPEYINLLKVMGVETGDSNER